MRTARLGKIALCLPGVLLTLGLWAKPGYQDDFRVFFRAARLVHSSAGVYSDTGGNTPDTFLPFVRVPSYAWMLRPLVSLGYQRAHIVWTAVLILALGVFLRMTRERRCETALAIFYSVPVAYSLLLGQDMALVVLIATAAVRLHAAKEDIAAGLVASLLVIKVTFLFPMALVFLARSRRGAWGLAAGTAIQLAFCFALEGWRWPIDYLSVLRNPLLDPQPQRMFSVRALVAGLPYGGLVFAVSAALIVGWLWFSARRLRFDDAVRVALPLGLIASPHCYVYEGMVAIPLFVTVASLHTRVGRLALFGLTPIPWLLVCGTSPAAAFIGSASVVAAVLFSTIQVYRERGTGGEEWSIRLMPDSVAPISPAN